MVKYNHSLSVKMDSLKSQGSDTLVPDKKKALSLGGVHYMKIGGMWNLKREISSPKLFELLTNT